VYLGIDIGTSAVKALLMDERGAIAGETTAALSVSRPKDLWSEQNPLDWWSAANEAVLGLDRNSRARVKAIGLSGQMHGATVLGTDDQPLRPAILWNDGRSAAQCRQLEEKEPRTRAITGNIAMPGFTAPKLLWLQRHEPDLFRRIKKVLLPKDYVRLCMTGDYASDLSDSAGTLWLDVGARAWSAPMLSACDLSEAHMPVLNEGPQVTGQLRQNVAMSWGMDQIPVIAGGGDNAAGAIGAGVTMPGQAFLSLGTSGVYFIASDRFSPNPDQAVHSFCHALPNRWHTMAVILSAASCLEWVTQLCGFDDVAQALQAAETHGPIMGTEIFLPYLSGERTPLNDPHAKGVFFGLTHTTERARLVQAVLEGVAFAFVDGQEVLLNADQSIDEVSVIGGGAQSRYWGKILAAALNRPLLYREGGEKGPAFGAARLARLCDTDETIEAVCSAPKISHEVRPDTGLAELMAERRPRYSELYKALQTTFAKTS